MGGIENRQIGLIGQIKKQLAERILAAELTHHLASESADEATDNHRNGSSPKTVLAPNGAFDLNIPRDRMAIFEPQLVAKYQRRLQGLMSMSSACAHAAWRCARYSGT